MPLLKFYRRGFVSNLLAILASVPFVSIVAHGVPLLGASAPPYYTKRATWQETMFASREALVRTDAARGAAVRFQAYTSPVVRGGEPAIHISVPVAGEKDVFLYVTGMPDPVGGAGTWAEAQLIGRDGTATRASRLPGLSVLEGRHAVDVNLKSGVSGPLTIAGRKFSHGIHVYADSKVRLPLEGKFLRFEAWIGIDDWVGRRGAVRFEVLDAAGAARHDLWKNVRCDFIEAEPRRQMRWEFEDQIWAADWTPGDYATLARRYAAAARRVPPLADEAAKLAAGASDKGVLNRVRDLYYRSRHLDESLHRAVSINTDALRLAIADLTNTFGSAYAKGPQFQARLESLEKELRGARFQRAEGSDGHVGNVPHGDSAASLDRLDKIASLVDRFDRLQREALLANPLLDFDRLLLVRREPHCDARWPMDTGYGMGEYLGLPRQSSKCAPGIEEPENWDNEIAVLQPVRPEGRLTTLFKPDGRRDILDVDLHWDADRMLFSMPGTLKKWQVFEIGADGRGLRQVTPGDQPDVHSYDPCYLPNGKIAFISTAPLQGVPCNAGVIVGMMYLMDADGRNIRQVCFEQDHDHCPTVLHDGRILYLRWDYTDTPHVWNRVLFAMNPDGTGQAEYYGSNSYWPNAIFYARPVPGHSTKVVGIVTGHHVGRVGELVIFDPAKGRRETDGVVQRIPGYGKKVDPIIEDKLTEHSWPKFLHPWPLSEKYFLVSCKPTPDALWGIYLVDVFDNMVLIKEVEGQALLEPIPLKKTAPPPILPDRTRPERNDAVVYMADVYQGPAMSGIPRGTVKNLRVFSYHFGYHQIAGIDHRVGTDGPWEVKRILGTVPVESDGSALFRIPAKTPVSVQPLDSEGRAVQLMRSWMTAMPGETLSCVGCHDPRNSTPPSNSTIAARRPPRAIQPWYGPARNFSFRAEIQPVLDRYCVGCHNGSGVESRESRVESREPRVESREPGNRSGRPPALDSRPATLDSQAFDLRGDQGTYIAWRGGDPQPHVVQGPVEKLVGRYGGIFEPSYFTLRSLVRVAGLESDLHLLPPMEFHAGSSELVQMLKKGHYGVRLDAEAWDRLFTWIDLNAPCHGTWGEFVRIRGNQRERRCELARLYGGVAEQLEIPPETKRTPIEPVMPPLEEKPKTTVGRIANPSYKWPFDGEEAKRRQQAAGPVTRSIDLGDGVKMELVRVPAGSFVMGDPQGESDEQPAAAVTSGKPFWMARCEVTNRQYACFDPAHESRFEHRGSWIFSEDYLGYPLDAPDQPVTRVSWNRAVEFCRWLSERTGLRFSLPTEGQWEYACRAGTATPFSHGGLDDGFSKSANFADATIRDLAYRSWGPKTPDLVPRDARFNDGSLVSAPVGSYRPNVWGLHDMHGNVAEWTRTAFSPYPYRDDDGRNAPEAESQKVVRGGSWRDRPVRCRSSFRLGYAPYQRVFNVGFRVVSEATP